MSVDSRTRFTATAADYEKWRPGYPAPLFDWLAATAGLSPGARVVDLGCGTGISSRPMAARGYVVTGVDPNQAMLERARAAGGGPQYLVGEAAATGLPAGSAELVIAAQAFHWFDLDATMDELARVLVPGGWAAAFWNLRASSPFLDAYEALIVEYSSEYRSMQKGVHAAEGLRVHPRVRNLRVAEFENAQQLDHEGFIGRVYSSSFVVHGIDRHEAFDRELDALFAQHEARGTVLFAYRTEALMWQV